MIDGFPPGPRGMGAIGLLPQAAVNLLKVAKEMQRTYGDISGLRVGPLRAVFLFNPKTIKSILGPQNEEFLKDKRYRSSARLLGTGLLTASGPLWRQQRKILQRAFRMEVLERYSKTMIDCTALACGSLKIGSVNDISAWVSKLTLEIAIRTFFSTDVHDLAGDLMPCFEILLDHWSRRARNPFALPEATPTPHNIRFWLAIRKLDQLFDRILNDRQASGSPADDLLGHLLTAVSDLKQPGVRKQIRDEFVTFVLAGYETTATNICWTICLLAQHDDIRLRVLNELSEVHGGREIAYGDLPQLKFLSAVLDESLRLFPPVWAFGREAKQTVLIDDYRIPAGTQIFVSPFLLHRDERFFSEPTSFRPDRWLDAADHKLLDYAYMPFGYGPRTCIGRYFARIEALIILAYLLLNYEVNVSDPYSVGRKTVITLRPNRQLTAVIHRKYSSSSHRVPTKRQEAPSISPGI
jgi:cytochrome P450